MSESDSISLKLLRNVLSDLLSLDDPKHDGNILQVRCVQTNNNANQNHSSGLRRSKKKPNIPHKNRVSAVDLFCFAAIMPFLLEGEVGNGHQRAAQRFIRIIDKMLP